MENPHFPSIQVLHKPGLFTRKPTWQNIPLTDLPAMVAGWSPQAFSRGDVALWLSARAETDAGRVYLPWLDVEDPADHDNIAANIAKAQHLYLCLDSCDLADGVTITATGRGFRFLWPWAIPAELGPAFLAMLADSANWPGIDRAPQVSGLPLSLAGYRGSKSQGRKGNVHFARVTPAELAAMTPAAYRARVHGPGDLAEAVAIARAIVPTGWTPDPWRAVLTEYRRDIELRRNVVRVRFPARPDARATSWEQIEDHLAARDIRVTKEITVEGHTVHLLSRCPACGKPHKARLTSGGRLKCWAASCPAGQTATDLRGQTFYPGLTLRAWAPELAPAEEAEEDQTPSRPGEAVTLEDARATVRAALAGKDDVLIRASAGVGKSYAGLSHALTQAQAGLVLITAPTTALAAEMTAQAMAMAADAGQECDIRQYQGRSPANCQQAERCARVAARGFSPGLLVCPGCVHKETCPHRTQLDGLKTGILVAAHAAAPFLVEHLDEKLILWICDESPLQYFLRSTSVGEGAMTALRARLVGQAEQTMTRTAEAAARLLAVVGKGAQGRLYATPAPAGEWQDTLPLWEAAGLTESDREALSRDLATWDRWQDEKPAAWQRRLLKDSVDLAALRWWWLALGERGQGSAYVRCRPHPRAPIQYRSLSNDTPSAPCRVVCLDATGDPAELAALFGRRFHVVDATVTPPPARRVWLRQGLGKVNAVRLAEEDPAKLSRHLAKAAGHLRPEDRRVLIVTHLAIEDRLLAMAREMNPDKEWAVAHHSAARGINAFADYDACVVVGTMTPNRAELTDTELALFGSDQAARDKWFSDLGRRDLIQSTARVRPVLSPKTVVVLGKDWPLESLGAPNFTLDGRRKGGTSAQEEEAYRVLLALAKEFGIMFHDLAASAGIFLSEDRAGLADWEDRWRPIYQGKTPLPFVLTQIRYLLIRVRTNSDPLSPIIINRRAWSALLSRLGVELGLPALIYRPTSGFSAGRGQAALGFLSTVRAFCQSHCLTWNPDLWAGEESAPIRTITYRIDPEPEEDPALTAEMEAIREAIFGPWTEEQLQGIIEDFENSLEIKVSFAQAA